MFNSKNHKAVRNINGAYGRNTKSKGCVLRHSLKEATEVAEWTDRGRLFQREGACERNALAPVVVLTLEADRVSDSFI